MIIYTIKGKGVTINYCRGPKNRQNSVNSIKSISSGVYDEDTGVFIN